MQLYIDHSRLQAQHVSVRRLFKLLMVSVIFALLLAAHRLLYEFNVSSVVQCLMLAVQKSYLDTY